MNASGTWGDTDHELNYVWHQVTVMIVPLDPVLLWLHLLVTVGIVFCLC